MVNLKPEYDLVIKIKNDQPITFSTYDLFVQGQL